MQGKALERFDVGISLKSGIGSIILEETAGFCIAYSTGENKPLPRL